MDKEKIKKILLIVISALTLAALALLLVIIVVSIAPGGIKGFEDYTVTDANIKTGSLVLADKDHPYSGSLSADSLEVVGAYRDANLEKDANDKPLNKYYMNEKSLMKLEKNAMSAAHNMLVAAEAAVKKDDLLIAYTYGYNLEDNEEYKTALLMYLTNYEGTALDPAYAEWFDTNAASYGFIESFENGYRYVGVVHATYMKANSMTLAQYINHLKTNTSDEKPLKASANGVEYQIYYVACKAGDTIKVPSKNEYTISGTNEGGVIITVKVSK